jgi:hypothetical protein
VSEDGGKRYERLCDERNVPYLYNTLGVTSKDAQLAAVGGGEVAAAGDGLSVHFGAKSNERAVDKAPTVHEEDVTKSQWGKMLGEYKSVRAAAMTRSTSAATFTTENQTDWVRR